MVEPSLGRVFRNRDPLSVRTDEMRKEHIVVAAGRTDCRYSLGAAGATPWPDVRRPDQQSLLLLVVIAEATLSDRGRILQSYKLASSICKHTTRRPETKRTSQTHVVIVGQNNER